MTNANLAPDVIAEIHHLRRTSTLTLRDISERFGISLRATKRHAAEVPMSERLRIKPNAIPPAVVERVRYLIQSSTMSFVAISAECGVSPNFTARVAATLEPGSFVERKSNAQRRVPDDTIAVIVQHAIDGLAYQEIAALVGHHIKTIESVIRRNRDEIRAAKVEEPAAQEPVDPVQSLAERLAADGWDDAFIASTVRNFSRHSISQVTS